MNSPVRAFRSVGVEPLFAARGSGPYLTDVEGRRLIDYVMSWGALLLGHNHPAVREALTDAAGSGTSYGITCEREIELAELVVRTVPSVEMVRFVNSGTEATMAALRLARAATGRELLLKFDGCYHGHGDSFLVSAGSGVATLGLPNSPGVPAKLAELTLTCPYNDIEAFAAAVRDHGERLAAVIVEPFVGNAGFIPPVQDFLPTLRRLTSDCGALLIFDEVMTGFRIHPGGAQALTGVMPDLTTLGKVLGGGLPVGAYGGRRELMEQVAPSGPVYQAGTLSGNPLAMAAGLATLKTALAEGVYDVLERRTQLLIEGLGAAGRSHGVPLTAAHAGSMWGIFFREEPVTSFAEAQESDTRFFARFYRAAVELGVFLAPSPFEAGFVSAAHSDEIVGETVESLGKSMARAAGS